MKSRITQVGIYMNIDSYMTVTHENGDKITISTPAKEGKEYADYYSELEVKALAYIAAFDESKPNSITLKNAA